VQVTVLGKSPAWQDSGGACSGYLIREGGYALLLDCGNGVFSKLREVVDYVDLDAVLITHMHSDHFFDLIPYSYALTYAPRQQPVPVAGWPGTSAPARPQLYAPSGAAEKLRQIVSCFGHEDLIEAAFALREYQELDELALGPLQIRFREVPHYTRTFAVDITAPDGSRFTFSADCSPNDEIVQLALDTDMLMIEATLPRPERGGRRGHLTPREAGEHGSRARARSLVLTHFSDELDADWIRGEAGGAYAGPVELAHDGAVFTVPGNGAPANAKARTSAAPDDSGRAG
jgi:ribonuclease BN (tRNA processing enzyme)